MTARCGPQKQESDATGAKRTLKCSPIAHEKATPFTLPVLGPNYSCHKRDIKIPAFASARLKFTSILFESKVFTCPIFSVGMEPTNKTRMRI